MSRSLSLDLRDGYRDLARQMGEAWRLEPVPSRVLFDGGRPRRGGLLRSVVLAYRAGPKSTWGPVLLELMAPAILDRLQHLQAKPPVIDLEDVRQQLIVELLLAAASMPLPENACYLRRALMSRANQGVRRKVAREGRIQLKQDPLDDFPTVAERAPSAGAGAGN